MTNQKELKKAIIRSMEQISNDTKVISSNLLSKPENHKEYQEDLNKLIDSQSDYLLKAIKYLAE